jgi:glycosyltransferase involved in cell wall biosynthesis
MKSIRLALNAWSLVSSHAGIASYTRNLALALRRSGAVELNLFYGLNWSSEIRDTAVAGVDSLKVWVKRMVPRPYSLMRFVQQRRFSAGIRGLNCDLYHEPGFLPFQFDGPTVITVHDLSPLRYPETHPPARVREVMERLPRAVQAASAIIVDSEFIRTELLQSVTVDPARVTSIHLGVAPEYRPRAAKEIAPALAQYGLSHRAYILAVGTLEPRKNLIQAINAYTGLPEPVKKATPLVIAGMRGWLPGDLEARIRQHEERGEVRWLGYVPADTLPMLYSAARMLVYPSLYEGFGLPVLEAMASGIPVITTNRASLPEVAGDVGLMVDPMDVDGLREQMRRLIEDGDEAARRGALGIERARQFTWEACAGKTLAVYRKALAA